MRQSPFCDTPSYPFWVVLSHETSRAFDLRLSLPNWRSSLYAPRPRLWRLYCDLRQFPFLCTIGLLLCVGWCRIHCLSLRPQGHPPSQDFTSHDYASGCCSVRRLFRLVVCVALSSHCSTGRLFWVLPASRLRPTHRLFRYHYPTALRLFLGCVRTTRSPRHGYPRLYRYHTVARYSYSRTPVHPFVPFFWLKPILALRAIAG